MLSNLSNNNAGNTTKSVVEKKHYEEIEARLDELQDEIDSNTESINQNSQDISGLDDRVAAVEDNSTFPELNTDTINPATGNKVEITSGLDVDGEVEANSISTSELSVNGTSFETVANDAAQAKSIAENAENKADEAYDLADALSDELADYKTDNEQSITTGTLNADSVVTDSIASQTINTNDFETTNAEIDELYVDRIHATGELALPTTGQSYYTITIPAGTTASFAGSYITENDEIEYFYFTVTDGDVIYHQAALEVIKDISFDRETGNTKIRVKSTGAITYISSSMNVADPTIEDGGSAYEDFSFIPQKLSGQIIRGYNDTTTETFVAGVLNAYAIVADEIHYERTVVDDLTVNDAIELPKEWNQSGNISRSSGTKDQYISIQTKDGVDKPTWVSPANGTTGVLDNTSDKLITEKSVACYNGSTCDGTVYPITNLGDGTSVHGSISATCFCGNVSGTADASLASCKANCLVDGNNNTVLSSDCVKVDEGVVSIGCRSNCNKRGTFIGHYAGVNSEFEDNTGIGRGALANLTRGQGNTAVGCEAGGLICCGRFNTAVGMLSARNGSGDFFDGNTSVGYNSLCQMCDGLYNIAIGYGAMSETCSGTRNIAIGTHTGNKRGCNEINNSITIGNRVCGKEDALTIGREFCCCLTYDFIDGSLCGANLCGNVTNAWRFNGCNYAQACADILRGTSNNSTCFAGCTYACAKKDILSGCAADSNKFNGKIYSEVCADILAGNAATATNATCFNGCTYSQAKYDIRNYTPSYATCTLCPIIHASDDTVPTQHRIPFVKYYGTTNDENQLNYDDCLYYSTVSQRLNAKNLCVNCCAEIGSAHILCLETYNTIDGKACTAYCSNCAQTVFTNGSDNTLKLIVSTCGWSTPLQTDIDYCLGSNTLSNVNIDISGCSLKAKTSCFTGNVNIDCNVSIGGNLNVTGTLTGTATNATCFNGCTYACAKADILSGCAADSAKLGNKDASCYIDNSSTAQTKAGKLCIGAPAGCTETSAGGNGVINDTAGGVHLYANSNLPYIHFHYNRYCGDFSTRIANTKGRLAVTVNDGEGCTAAETSNIFDFCSDGTFKGAKCICGTNIYQNGSKVIDSSSNNQTKAGSLCVGALSKCTETSAGGNGVFISCCGCLGLYANQPSLNFYYNKFCGNYSSRLIANAKGRLVAVVTDADGCCAETTRATYCFCSDGSFTGACTICASTNIYSAGCPVVTTGNIATVAPGYNCTGTSNYVVTTMVCCACHAKTIDRTATNDSHDWHIPLTWSNTTDTCTSYGVSCGCPLTYKPSTGVLKACHFCDCLGVIQSTHACTCAVNLGLTVGEKYSLTCVLTKIYECYGSYPATYTIVMTNACVFCICEGNDWGYNYVVEKLDNGAIDNAWTQTKWRVTHCNGTVYNIMSRTESGTTPTWTIKSNSPTSCISTSSTNADYPLVFSTCCATPAAGNRTLYNDSANNLMYNPGTNTLTAYSVRGASRVIVRNPTDCTSTQTGSDGAEIGCSIDLYASIPVIDFHVDNACDDYSHRLRANNGYLRVTATNATGCTASTQSANFDFCSDGTFSGASTICANTISVGNTYTTCNSQKICVNNKLWELCCDGHIYFEGSLVI